MHSDLTPQERQAVVQQHVTALMEHFESVQILVSVLEPDGTGSCFLGAGNWFARQGMARDFMQQDQARTAAREISLNTPPDDEGETWKK